MTLRQALFSFRGRMGRRDYFVIMGGMSAILIGFFIWYLFSLDLLRDNSAIDITVSITYLTLLPVFTWIMFATGAKRFHDMGKSGWFQLLYLIPFGNTIVPIYLVLKKGDALPNRFGAPQPPFSSR